MSETKDVNLLKIQIISEQCHAILTSKLSFIFGALIGFMVLFYTLYYNETFSPFVFWVSLSAVSVICFSYVWSIIKTYNRNMKKISVMIEKVKQGEELPPLEEIDIVKEAKSEKEKKPPVRTKSTLGNNMTEKSHAQRFDEVFRLILIIEALFFNLVLKISSFENKVLFIILFSATLLLWIFGHLLDGKYEYVLKIEGLYTSVNLILGLLVTSITDLYTKGFLGLAWVYWFVIFFIPMISFFCCFALVIYLEKSINRKLGIAYVLASNILYIIVVTLGLFLF